MSACLSGRRGEVRQPTQCLAGSVVQDQVIDLVAQREERPFRDLLDEGDPSGVPAKRIQDQQRPSRACSDIGHGPALWWISVPGCGHPASTSRMWAVPTTQSLYVQQSASTEKTRSGLATNRVVSAMTWGFLAAGRT
jgi:hypothetical protein